MLEDILKGVIITFVAVLIVVIACNFLAGWIYG